MKQLKDIIVEKLIINKNIKNQYKYQPIYIKELVNCIKKELEIQGKGTKENPLDLNCIDIRNMKKLNLVFDSIMGAGQFIPRDAYIDVSRWDLSNITETCYTFKNVKFHFDVSNWDMSNVESMNGMFYDCIVECNLSKWDVSNIRLMNSVFYGANFNGDISNWDVKNVESMSGLFSGEKCTFNQDISGWDVSNVNNMDYMFMGNPVFNQNLDNWKVGKTTSMDATFNSSLLENNPPKWYHENYK